MTIDEEQPTQHVHVDQQGVTWSPWNVQMVGKVFWVVRKPLRVDYREAETRAEREGPYTKDQARRVSAWLNDPTDTRSLSLVLLGAS